MASSFDYDKAERKEKLYKFNSNVVNVESDRKFDAYLKKMNDKKNFDKEKYDFGAEFFNNGGRLEETPQGLKENFSFKSGYEHAKRLAMIQEKNNGKSR